MLSLMTSLLPNVMLWLLLLGALLLWCGTKDKRRATRWGWIFLLALWLLGTRPVTEVVLWPLESRYIAPNIATLIKERVTQVVVLTGGGYPVRGEMLSAAFPHASMYRFLNGLELCSRLGPDCRLIFSGSAGRKSRDLTTALTMQELCLLLRPGSEVLAEARSGSTAEHPRNVHPLVRSGPFVLVTSAVHMPRSMRSFGKAGLNPIPYPVDFLAMGGPYGWASWIPSVENLWNLGVALREYLALVFYAVKGW